MKKVLAALAILGAMMTSPVVAQDAEPAAQTTQAAAPQQEEGMHQVLKTKVIEGGVGYMGAVLMCLIIGLALSIERIVYLSLASTNTKKLLGSIEEALNVDDTEKAKEIARNTRGPIASIFYQGLTRVNDGAEMVEKTVGSYGSVQMGQLETNVTWISLMIALAPMLGFMGTVIGMIQAFDKIQMMGDISATVVAGGIKVALLTTVGGLIVAMILQLFLNFILTRIEAITTEMEDASISLLDIIVKYEEKKANGEIVAAPAQPAAPAQQQFVQQPAQQQFAQQPAQQQFAQQPAQQQFAQPAQQQFDQPAQQQFAQPQQQFNQPAQNNNGTQA